MLAHVIRSLRSWPRIDWTGALTARAPVRRIGGIVRKDVVWDGGRSEAFIPRRATSHDDIARMVMVGRTIATVRLNGKATLILDDGATVTFATNPVGGVSVESINTAP
jgi:hypothetical protein